MIVRRTPTGSRLQLHFLAALPLVVLAAACGDDGSSGSGGTGASSGGSGAACGDGICGPGESCSSCSTDCDPCASGAGGEGAAGSGGSGSATGGAGGSAPPPSCPATPEPARYPLELVSPRAAGSSPSQDPGTPAMPAGHRIFSAYPGLEYDIRAVVIGGAYPFTFTLADAPTGMTIDAGTGRIHWPAPNGASATPRITVTDCEGTQQSASWTITVGADAFRFVDAANGSDENPGTAESPWQTLDGVREGGSPSDIVYFRNGTYSTDGLVLDGSDTWVRVEMNASVHPVRWIAYPGENPVIDNGYSGPTDTGQFLRFIGTDDIPVYLDGLEIVGSWDKGMQFGAGSCDYPVFRRLDIHDIAEAIDGSNSAGIMTVANYPDPSVYAAYQDNDFHDNACGGIKQYSHQKLLWEDCQFRNSGDGPDLKSHVPRFEVRGCSFHDNSGGRAGLFGNMNEGQEGNELASGEIRYNMMLTPGSLAQIVNQDSQAAEIHLYRNTFVGDVLVLNADSDDGPFRFTRNVIVNESDETDHISLEGVSDPSVIIYLDNLTGYPADGIVDSGGVLQGQFTSFLGSRGHQLQ
jgi:hypothetical protein